MAKESVLGKWYAVVYSLKLAGQLFFGKIVKHFLVDENHTVETLEVCCLKPKVGSGTLVDDSPSYLLDICLFNLADVIYGPLEVVPMGAQKFDVPKYQEVVKHFNRFKKLERNALI